MGRPRDKRVELLQRALELFASRGYDAVGVQEIAGAAGVSKPTLYHYFGSKRGLLQALLGGQFESLHRVLLEAAVYRRDLTAALRSVAGALFRFAEEQPLYYRLQLSMWFAPTDSGPFEIVSALNGRLQCVLEGLFQSAVEEHGNMRERHQSYAASFLGIVNAYIGLALNGYVRLDEQLAQRVTHQFEHGIYS